ncbi:condensation domain-containing protein [Streptomyces sp. VB1]|uniref:condensation domain-containing protein n=1 Tax=Streptomyces sp. VB1 TaxID=2986803 RepID=UPI00224212BB|nr:condensation domain-containing protein [Streptomyces sp. VB1]UZI32364.1 condensation domain-containing protein [Streptomyces sp. VB1]
MTTGITLAGRALARRLADYAVLAHDPAVPAATAGYWEMSRAHYTAVDGETRGLLAAGPAVAQAHRALVARPDDPARHRELTRLLTGTLHRFPPEQARLGALVGATDREIWLDHHLGDRHTPGRAPFEPEEVHALARPRAKPPGADGPQVHVVIPFRDRTGGGRTRNLLACLIALRDQDYAAGPVRVTVVETDAHPRRRELIEPLVDSYVFAAHDGRFNKSWTVNVGVVAEGAGSAYTCVLDADILVDRSFVRRNVQRFLDDGHTAHVCSDRSLSLDAPSTAEAIARRCGAGDADVPLDVLRGVLLREPPGGALWTRSDAYAEVGGFDERFEGWGGEDEDITRRLRRSGDFRRYGDAPLLHLDHPRPPMRDDAEQPFNAHVEMGAWDGGDGYGDPFAYTGAAPRSTVAIAFSATARPPGPLMWGQRLLWNDSQWLGENDHYFNMTVSVPVPPGPRLTEVLDCLRHLVQRHEAPRSRVVLTPAGEPLQEVLPSGSIDVLLAEAAPDTVDEIAVQCHAELFGRSFHLADAWPMRPCVVSVQGAPARVTLVLSHVFADAGAAAVLAEELTELLAGTAIGELPGQPPAQPLDRAAYENSPAGRKLSAIALRRLDGQLRSIPQTMFPGPILTPDPYRFRRMEMRSPALTEALRRTADREKASTSTVLLATLALVLATATGQRTAVFKTVLSNRAFPDLERLVGNALSNGVVPVGIEDVTFARLVDAVGRVMMGNLLRSQCDPTERDAVTAAVAHERGVHVDLSVFFNDTRDITGGREPRMRSEADLDALSAQTRTSWVGAWERQDAKFFFHTRSDSDCDPVYAMVDTAFLPSASVDALLRGLERVAVRVAEADRPVRELRKLLAKHGLDAPVRGPDWLLVDHCWVRPADVEAALAAALPAWPSEVSVTEGEDGPTLTAHVACGDPSVSSQDLHRAVVAVLPDFPAAMAPSRYLITPAGGPPAGAAGELADRNR